MSNDWQVDIESRLVYQEDLIDQLNSVITAQQLEMEELKRTCKLLYKKIAELEDDLPQNKSATEQKPPHY